MGLPIFHCFELLDLLVDPSDLLVFEIDSLLKIENVLLKRTPTLSRDFFYFNSHLVVLNHTINQAKLQTQLL